MDLLNKQSFWITLASLGLGSFTTFNTFQLERSTKASEDTQQEIMMLQQDINQIQLRMDNVYDKLVELETANGGRRK